MNIVGGHQASFAPLGLWDDTQTHDERHDVADEWIEVVKRYWTEVRVNEAGVDLVGLDDLAQGYKKNTKGFKDMSSSSMAPLGGTQYRSVMPGTFIGSHETLAHKIAMQVQQAELDGILLIVPDYIAHLQQVGLHTLPLLAEHGIECDVGRAA
jgi:alkanesulfonate monooxygenase SsuD/methylene tetrahydromethanopterin reductase-like flavin-dependent oxidoreductase (luciferase family)